MAVHGQLLVGPDVKEPAGGVIRPRCESAPVREEGDRVDVGLVAGEGLLAHTLADVPQLQIHSLVVGRHVECYLLRKRGCSLPRGLGLGLGR